MIPSLFSTHVPNHALSDTAAQTRPRGSKKYHLVYILGGALVSTSLIQGLVSTYDELRARLAPRGGIFPDPAPPSTVWTAYQITNHKNLEY